MQSLQNKKRIVLFVIGYSLALASVLKILGSGAHYLYGVENSYASGVAMLFVILISILIFVIPTLGIVALGVWYRRKKARAIGPVKPESKRPRWQQDLINGAKAGKVVEFYDGSQQKWSYSLVNDWLEETDFGSDTKDMYRFKPVNSKGNF